VTTAAAVLRAVCRKERVVAVQQRLVAIAHWLCSTFQTRELRRDEPRGRVELPDAPLDDRPPGRVALDRVDKAAGVEVDVSHGQASRLARLRLAGRCRPFFAALAAAIRSRQARRGAWASPRARHERALPLRRRDLRPARRARYAAREAAARTTMPRSIGIQESRFIAPWPRHGSQARMSMLARHRPPPTFHIEGPSSVGRDELEEARADAFEPPLFDEAVSKRPGVALRGAEHRTQVVDAQGLS
jgi:hypothetical protein